MASNVVLTLASKALSVFSGPSVPDLPGGQQHWRLSGTFWERGREQEVSPACGTRHTALLTHAVGSLQTKWSEESCKALIASNPKEAFLVWRGLYREHVSYAIDYALWTWTQAFATEILAENSIISALDQLLDIGFGDFYEEVVFRDDFFGDAPVRCR